MSTIESAVRRVIADFRNIERIPAVALQHIAAGDAGMEAAVLETRPSHWRALQLSIDKLAEFIEDPPTRDSEWETVEPEGDR